MAEARSTEEMQRQMLRLLYDALFAASEDSHGNLIRFAADHGYDQQDVWDAFDGLVEAGLAAYFAGGGEVEITTAGVLHVEENAMADPELVSYQLRVRTRLMDALYGLHEEHGRRAHLDWTLVVETAGVSEEDFDMNISFLKETGLMRTGASVRALEITDYGRHVVEDYRRRRGLAEEFEALKEQRDMTPQERGRRFEGLLGAVIAAEGWAVEQDVAIPGEQNDLMVHQGNDYYLVEAKWEKAPASPEKVSRLAHKVSKRPGMRGVLVSMRGFTDAAKEDARDLLMQGTLLLLFGPEDVEAAVAGTRPFSKTLSGKVRAAMLRREVVAA